MDNQTILNQIETLTRTMNVFISTEDIETSKFIKSKIIELIKKL